MICGGKYCGAALNGICPVRHDFNCLLGLAAFFLRIFMYKPESESNKRSLTCSERPHPARRFRTLGML